MRCLTLIGLTSLLPLLGCGEELFMGSFTSRVVQREVCRLVGNRPEVCAVDEKISELRLQLIERAGGHVWLYGLPRRGAPERALLGTRDAEGGFLFVDEITSADAASGCVVGDRLEIVVSIDPEAEDEDVGTSACVALVGRETASISSSAECDTVNTPPLPSTVVSRRRWEPAEECER